MSNIDEKAKNILTIEMRIFENYEKVKYEIIKVIDFLRHVETNLGIFGLWLLCVLCLGMPLTWVEIFVCV